MSIFGKLKGRFREDWCDECRCALEETARQLYALPAMRVGHYVSHREPKYLKKNLVPVAKKAEIPAGMYACGVVAYRCPECGRRRVRCTFFLPVRGEEKVEEHFWFDGGEVDELLWKRL